MVEEGYYSTPFITDPGMLEGAGSLQDWLVAIADDQIRTIDDNAANDNISFLTRHP